jgi:threonine dehydratase
MYRAARVQVSAVRALGGIVRLVGESYTETQSYAWKASVDEGRAFIAPYDDPLTIAGQGTIGIELMKQLGSRIDNVHAIFVPIGGGGLFAGIAAYVKALRPSVKVIGVEPSGANCMAQSLKHGQRVQLSKVDAFADGVAVKSVGAVRFAFSHLLSCEICCQHREVLVPLLSFCIFESRPSHFSKSFKPLSPASCLFVGTEVTSWPSHLAAGGGGCMQEDTKILVSKAHGCSRNREVSK